MREPGRIHAATLEGSARLRAVLAFLKQRGPIGASTRELIEGTGFVAINSIAAELRQCGETILCKHEGRSPNGSAVYRYFWHPPLGLQSSPGAPL